MIDSELQTPPTEAELAALMVALPSSYKAIVRRLAFQRDSLLTKRLMLPKIDDETIKQFGDTHLINISSFSNQLKWEWSQIAADFAIYLNQKA